MEIWTIWVDVMYPLLKMCDVPASHDSFHGNLRYPFPKATPPIKKQGLMIRDYENPLVSLNKALLRDNIVPASHVRDFWEVNSWSESSRGLKKHPIKVNFIHSHRIQLGWLVDLPY